MPGWATKTVLPSYIHLFSRLSRKVGLLLFICIQISYICDRIALASIRNLGNCPCPRCLTPLSDAHKFGMAMDQKKRRTLARTDDRSRQIKVSSAWKLIYCNNYAVNSAPVESLLKETSLVPTSVCIVRLIRLGQELTSCITERIF
jgi:hypothetical protein